MTSNSILPKNETKNPGCKRKCSDDARPDGICQNLVSDHDSQPVRCVGSWARDKIGYLEKYFGIFAGGMKFKWNGHLNYIEICSGPGRCILRETGDEIDGTSLAILRHSNFVHVEKAFFVDFNEQVVDILNKRIQALGDVVSKKSHAIHGDYKNPEKLVHDMRAKGLNNNSLNLVFIDPTDCSVPFETMRYLRNNLGRADLVINFPFGTDMNRNIKSAILDPAFGQLKQKYASFLGDQDFLTSPEVVRAAELEDQETLKNLMNQKYNDQLASLGYLHRDPIKIKSYYYLCFFSTDPKGLEFWKKAKKHAPNGQTNFEF